MRLRQLEAAGIVERVPGRPGPEYVPTEAGWELYPIVEAMGRWGQRWARSRYTPDLDPSLLMWDMRMLLPAGLAPSRTVVEFRFSRAPVGRPTYWLVVDLRALTEVWMGDRTMADAIAAGAIELHGPRRLVRSFPDWLGQHPVLGPIGPATHRADTDRVGATP